MSLELFGHPFSSYTWKPLIALYETGTPFTFRNVAGNDYPENEAAFLAHWPVGKFPLLVDDGVPIMESSIIIEHIAPALIPDSRKSALEQPEQTVVVVGWRAEADELALGPGAAAVHRRVDAARVVGLAGIAERGVAVRRPVGGGVERRDRDAGNVDDLALVADAGAVLALPALVRALAVGDDVAVDGRVHRAPSALARARRASPA